VNLINETVKAAKKELGNLNTTSNGTHLKTNGIRKLSAKLFRSIKDEHDLVRKGYGWMVKILSIKEPQLIFDYLLKNKNVMPRVSYCYALEKMDPKRRKILVQ
jgi:3-methyladenine DNA glycosylase AlkD